ncbi:hypothetical protein [Goodfellowiella coeruleoviolacea]|uniref:Uncharacterized protein n=1 Tax=Goodfellowiella coeruleoviolacea TaxID=334858 RepID=A0AAE3KEB3_9PSEU|nr:hypothetical protein [Goodfellowiella coeruleoviolacea]MCP2163732.1 hypothetical protein [Goodfellowiella coeruleoviolacea]
MKKALTRMLLPLLTMLLGLGLTTAPAQAVPGLLVVEPRVLGPDGYRALTLGMPEAAAVATGLLTGKENYGGSCNYYYFVPSVGSMPRASGVLISPSKGVTAIGATSKMRTPEGIRRDHSSLSDLRAAYPELTRDSVLDFVYRTPVPGNPAASYRFVIVDGLVSDFGLDSGASC